MADILISYTSSDRDWAEWIAWQLEALGHTPHVHDWEISGGGDLAAWMEKRHQEADRVLCIISKIYFDRPYSTWERRTAQWAAATNRPNFVLPVFVEPCEPPTMLAHLKRCDLFGINDDADVACERLKAFLMPAQKPTTPPPFPVRPPGGEAAANPPAAYASGLATSNESSATGDNTSPAPSNTT